MKEDWPPVVCTPSLPVMERQSLIPEVEIGNPEYINELYLLNDRQAFADILADLRHHNRDIWVEGILIACAVVVQLQKINGVKCRHTQSEVTRRDVGKRCQKRYYRTWRITSKKQLD
jgi:hypothetical protein